MRKSRLSKAKQKVKIRHIKQFVKECLTGLSGAAPNINEEVANYTFQVFRNLNQAREKWSVAFLVRPAVGCTLLSRKLGTSVYCPRIAKMTL